MKTINGTTKKGRELTANYLGAQFTNIYQVYETCSYEKRKAEYLCKLQMANEYGNNFRIISWNTFQFTCGWILPNGNIRIETARNSYLIKEPILPF